MVGEVSTPKLPRILPAVSIGAGVAALVLALVIPQLAPHLDLHLIMLMLVLPGAGSLATGIYGLTAADTVKQKMSLKLVALGFVLMILGLGLPLSLAPVLARARPGQGANPLVPFVAKVLALLGFILIAVNIGTGIYHFIRRSAAGTTVPVPQQNQRSGHLAGEEVTVAKKVFCSQCGERLTEGDKFCASCGVRVGPRE